MTKSKSYQSGQGELLEKAKRLLKKWSIPIAGASAIGILYAAAELSKSKKERDDFNQGAFLLEKQEKKKKPTKAFIIRGKGKKRIIRDGKIVYVEVPDEIKHDDPEEADLSDLRNESNKLRNLSVELNNVYAFEGFYDEELEREDLSVSEAKQRWKNKTKNITSSEFIKYIVRGKRVELTRSGASEEKRLKKKIKELKKEVKNEIDEIEDPNQELSDEEDILEFANNTLKNRLTEKHLDVYMNIAKKAKARKGKGFMASKKELKKALKNVDEFKKKHPKEAKQLGLGKGKTDAKELEKLLIDLSPGLNDVQVGGRPSVSGVLKAALIPAPLRLITPTRLLNATVDAHNLLARKKPDPKDQKLEKGEVHAVFKNKDGALARATFCGPGTKITKKVKKLLKKHNGDIKKAVAADNFISESDKICMLHDLRYYIDGKDSDKVRHADNKMLEKLKEAKEKGESKFNILPSELGIKAKVKLEDLGIMRKGSFADGMAKEELKPEDFELLVKVKEELEQQGYGQMKARPMREKRQSPWIKFVKDYACEHDVDYGTALKEASLLWKQKGSKKRDKDAI